MRVQTIAGYVLAAVAAVGSGVMVKTAGDVEEPLVAAVVATNLAGAAAASAATRSIGRRRRYWAGYGDGQADALAGCPPVAEEDDPVADPVAVPDMARIGTDWHQRS